MSVMSRQSRTGQHWSNLPTLPPPSQRLPPPKPSSSPVRYHRVLPLQVVIRNHLKSEPEPVARGKGRGQKQAKAAKGRPARRGGPRVYKKVLYYNHKRVRVDEVDDSSDSDEPSDSDVEESEEEHETTRRPRMRRVARRPTLRRAAPRKVTYADKLIGDGDEDDEDRGGDRADDAVEGAGPFYYM